MKVRIVKKTAPKNKLIDKNQKKLTDCEAGLKNAAHPMNRTGNWCSVGAGSL
jgi:hypothetical protein